VNETPRKGDLARFTYVARVEGMGDHPKFVKWAKSGDMVIAVPADATIEILERADDPSKDPIGTRREMAEDDESRADSSPLGPYAVRWTDTGGHPWVWFRWDGPQLLADDTVTGWRKVDPMPGTPAAEAEQADTDRDSLPDWERDLVLAEYQKRQQEALPCPVTPRVFPSNKDEPPQDVQVLEWVRAKTTGAKFLHRNGEGWSWAASADASAEVDSYAMRWSSLAVLGEFREVLP
jgi:hypothetical protein